MEPANAPARPVAGIALSPPDPVIRRGNALAAHNAVPGPANDRRIQGGLCLAYPVTGFYASRKRPYSVSIGRIFAYHFAYRPDPVVHFHCVDASACSRDSRNPNRMPESRRPSARTAEPTRSRRAFGVGASASALTLVACGDEESPEVDVVPTEIPTQAEPTPTQPPISSPAAGYLDPNRYTGQTVTVATAGAAEFLDALHEAFFDAFERDTGATVEHAEFGRDGTENLAAQVES